MVETPGAMLTQEVYVREEDPESPTGGHFGTESIPFDAPAGGVTYKSVTVAIPIALLAASLDAKSVQDGDLIGFDVNPDTVLGVLPSAVAGGVSDIPAPAALLGALDAGAAWAGMVLSLKEGVTRDDLGVIIAWNTPGGTVTVHKPTVNAFTTAAQVLLTVSMSPCIINEGWVEVAAGDNKILNYGRSKIGASHIKKDATIRIRYDNKGTTQVRVRPTFEYLY